FHLLIQLGIGRIVLVGCAKLEVGIERSDDLVVDESADSVIVPFLDLLSGFCAQYAVESGLLGRALGGSLYVPTYEAQILLYLDERTKLEPSGDVGITGLRHLTFDKRT